MRHEKINGYERTGEREMAYVPETGNRRFVG